ncbi:MAG: 2Fe-2S iron-sulfur cluster-binding protein [Acidiferrobacterales bacterium]
MQKQEHQIILSPSGHTFTVEPGETVLEAALRSGYAVNYHCANGTCGDCRARIIEGVVAEQLPYDYVFKGDDRNQPMLLMCRSIPGSDMTIEVSEANSVEDIPHQEIVTQVMHRANLNDDIVELQLRTPRSQTLRFLAGQEVKLVFKGVGETIKPLASCPCNGRDLMFHFYKQENDPVTSHVFNDIKIRDSVTIDGPYGEFILQQPLAERIVFVAYNSGFAPIKSLIEYVLSLDLATPVDLFWLASKPGWHYLGNQCRAWQDVITNFNFELINTNCLKEGPENQGDCLELLFESRRDKLDGADVYLAGPQSLADAVTRNFNTRILQSLPR